MKACQSLRSGLLRSLPRRHFSSQSAIVGTLQEKVKALAEKTVPQTQALRKEHGAKSLGDVTVGMCIGGMRGIKCMVSETSYLDPMEGIRYRGRTLKECNEQLTKAEGGKVGLPEAAFWLLLTNEMPTDAETEALIAELHSREELPNHVAKLIDSLPKTMHPMTQLSMGLLALQPDSTFGQAYRAGAMKKTDYWTKVLDDSLTLVAKMPILSARIFRNIYADGQHIPSDKSLDWAGNFAHMLGVNDSPAFKEVTRLYLMIHADHEAGNVSAHTTHLVGSALSDPFLAFSAGVNGLAGPLHGLANQECLRWLKATQQTLGGKEPTVEILTQFAKDTLASGKVIPGYGHGALRVTDPRYIIQQEFAKEHMANDPLFKLANVCYEAIPPVLEATGKVSNPWPNVDALSGTCMQHYGLSQEDYYTVVFAVSRSLGCMSNLVWARLMGLPIERPKSVTLDWIAKNAK
uniref:Citrate synthase n=1 Tax=Alexandrium catenella TaxID=2925 RepID=A0A7S1RY72_ALECA|mmetsp:Transcript_78423/g.208242  ORF Transcript_78423/g.208242 Transcript_78423/m.208242 type:complete len:462 (+) Transcript_78423:82-1467(+)